MSNILSKTATRWLVFGTLACCLLVTGAYAQETTAGIEGHVKDQSGAVVANATVSVASPALLGSGQKATTDSAGAYRFSQLPIGTYTLTVTAQGFRSYKQSGIDLSTGRLPTIDVTMQVGAVEQTVEVTSEAPIVDVTQSKVAVEVQREIIDNIPKGRSAFSLIPMAPGARQEPLQSVGRGAGGFQIDGASDSENVYMADGMNITNIQDGGVGKAFQTDFVQEVQIKSSSFEAEYGGAVGGVVNVIAQRGKNTWHGSLLTYAQLSALNANDPCNVFTGATTGCGLRLRPGTSLSTANRTDGTPEYYVPKKDYRRILEPGYTVGGPIFKNKLFLFSSYIPTSDTLRRTVQFTGASNPGKRNFTRTFTQHNAYNRLDYGPFNSLKLYASWNYAYSRTTGSSLPTPDSAYGFSAPGVPCTTSTATCQLNTGAGIDPATIRADFGSVNPNAVYAFGADWTPSSKLVVSGRFGYWFTDNQDRGRPEGIRYAFNTNVTAQSRDLAGGAIASQVAASLVNVAFTNMSSNFQTLFDAYKRHDTHINASYFVGNFWGSHTFKGGYDMMRQANDVVSGYKTALVTVNWDDSYSVQTSATACDSIITANVTTYGASAAGKCRGKYGYFTVQDGVDVNGKVSAFNHGLYFQDAWTVGHTGLTLNLGVRMDKEFLPPYRAGADHISFDFSQKVAPRIGGAYDLLHNGKVKLFASYGKFFDIMKYGLPRGSFGGDYWRNCVYAMDFTDFTTIQPQNVSGHACGPTVGPANGVTVGRFIEHLDLRKNVINTTDPGVDPKIKPMEQHEFVVGTDWAVSPMWSFETRYARKRLDWAIEDIGITDNLGFYIGNPGTTFGDLLHRAASGSGITQALCPSCPAQPKAIRNYDGLEFRLSRRPGAGKWWGAINYTYSRLYGNYAGLTNTDPTDGSGGRHSPNNHRDFDWPTMQFVPSGAIQFGPLATDRPNTVDMQGFYRLPWFHQETVLGFTQALYAGTPVNTCIPVFGTASSCQYAENRGNWVNFSRAANGDWTVDSVDRGRRTPAYTNTNFNLSHEVKVSSTHENMRLRFEATVFNLFNIRNAMAYNETPTGSTAQKINFFRTAQFAGDPGFDWAKVLGGWDYRTAPNQQALTLAARYGFASVYQPARSMILGAKFTF